MAAAARAPVGRWQALIVRKCESYRNLIDRVAPIVLCMSSRGSKGEALRRSDNNSESPFTLPRNQLPNGWNNVTLLTKLSVRVDVRNLWIHSLSYNLHSCTEFEALLTVRSIAHSFRTR